MGTTNILDLNNRVGELEKSYPASHVMMSDGVTSVDDAVDELTSGLTSLLARMVFHNTFEGSVLAYIKAMASGTVEFFVNSNLPADCPTGCHYGAYLFIKQNGMGAILYWDNSHLAHVYGVSSDTTQLSWHIL